MVTALGRCRTGILVTDGHHTWFVTECCVASAKGSMGAIVCRACYEEVDDSLGGVYDEKFDGPLGPLTDADIALLTKHDVRLPEGTPTA